MFGRGRRCVKGAVELFLFIASAGHSGFYHNYSVWVAIGAVVLEF